MPVQERLPIAATPVAVRDNAGSREIGTQIVIDRACSSVIIDHFIHFFQVEKKEGYPGLWGEAVFTLVFRLLLKKFQIVVRSFVRFDLEPSSPFFTRAMLFQNIILISRESPSLDDFIRHDLPIHHAEDPLGVFRGKGLMRHEDNRLPLTIQFLENPHDLES